MSVEEYLEQIEKIDSIIVNKREEINQWKAIASNTTAPIQERVQSSGSMQKMADAVNIYVDIEAEITEEIKKLVEKKREFAKIIEELPVDEYKVLHKKYISGMELKEVASHYQKDYSWATKTHRNGLKMLQRILDRKEAYGQEWNRKFKVCDSKASN